MLARMLDRKAALPSGCFGALVSLAVMLSATSSLAQTPATTPYEAPANGDAQGAVPEAQTLPAYASPSTEGTQTVSPSIPPPTETPKRVAEYEWAVRFNPIDLVLGRANLEVEHAITNKITVEVAPQYVYGNPFYANDYSLSISGADVLGRVGYWLDGEALQGHYLKAQLEYDRITYKSDDDHRLPVPTTALGIMYGAQSILGGFFAVSWGIGISYDFSAKDRELVIPDPNGGGVIVEKIPATGPLHNGFDVIGQFAFGAAF